MEVYVTTDTSAAPHKAGEANLYVMYDAADPDGEKPGETGSGTDMDPPYW